MDIPFNLLIFPFLGGYLFVRFWNYSRIQVMRSDKERLIIRSALAGTFLYAIAFLIRRGFAWGLPCQPDGLCLASWWNQHFSAIADVSVMTLGLGLTLPWLVNLLPWFNRTRQIARAIEETADPLENFLKRARDEELAVAITLSSGKVYIAKVTQLYNPANPTDNLGLIPLSSGYRDTETKGLILTINYTNVIAKITEKRDVTKVRMERLEARRSKTLKENKNADTNRIDKQLESAKARVQHLERQIDMFLLVLPVNQIISICFFDSEIHAEYFQTKEI
jgi:hypothetical protein